MIRIYLERYEPEKKMHRFYQMHVTPGIFGDWSLVKEWGNVGLPGTVRKEWFASEEEARQAGEKIRLAKEKRGYRSTLAIQ